MRVPKDVVAQFYRRLLPARLSRKCSGDRVAASDELTSPADFYAGLRYYPLVMKSGFCFAQSGFK